MQTTYYKGLRITIEQDEFAEMPFSECISVFYKSGGRYVLGTDSVSDYEMDRIQSEAESGNVWSLPVFAYVHGDVSLSTVPFSCPWDSGLSGIATASKDVFRTETEGHNAIRLFLKELNLYLSGNVWCYTITDDSGNVLDSLCGLIGLEYARDEAERSVDSILAL